MSLVHFLTLLVIYRADIVASFSNGAQENMCPSMTPRHGSSTATGVAPYNLSLSASTYNPDDVIQVTLSGLSGSQFKGFLIVARRSNGQTDNIGNFTAVTGSKIVCSNTSSNGVTHTDATVKSSVTFNWTAPSASAGDLVFHYTVVRGGAPSTASNRSDYFADQTSGTLKADLSSFTKNPECGKTRGCFSSCLNNTCDWELSWKEAGTDYEITIKSVANTDNTYFALGFTNTPGMSPASVVACTIHNGQLSVNASFNSGYSNRLLGDPKEGISNETNSYANGLLECSFSRVTISSNPEIFNLTEPSYLIAAYGPLRDDGTLRNHGHSNRFRTSTQISLSNVTTDYSIPVIITTPASSSGSTAPPTPNSFTKNPDCGKTRGCFSDCFNNVCDWELSWKNAGAHYEITIKSFVANSTYVALGFSSASAMSPASVVACTIVNGQSIASASYNTGYSNSLLVNPKEGIINETNSYVNGLLECSFSRVTTSSNPQIFNLTEPWYLITAKGSVISNNLQYHGPSNRYLTPTLIDLSDATTDYSFSSKITTPVSSASTAPPSPASTFTKDNACGHTRGCYSNCKNNVCDLLLSWANVRGNFSITLKSGFSATGNHYIAFGLSEDSKMFKASVVACTVYQSTTGAYTSFNPDLYNVPLNPQEGLSNITSKFEDGILSCTVLRVTNSSNNQIYDLTKDWYLITARGVASQGGSLTNHGASQAFKTTSKINFSDPSVDISLEETDYPLVKAHGCLMVIAWMLAASLGLAMARFFKKLWPDRKLGGVKLWFAVHRAAMVMTFLIGIAAFIIIFIQVQGYSEISGENFKKAHPIMGIIVTALLFINPFMSLLRCGPDHPRRPIFNWAHWLVGTSAHILGGITIAFGLYLPKANLVSNKGLIIMIVYGSWHLVFFFIMSFIDYMSNRSQSKTAATGDQPVELKDVQPQRLGNNTYELNGSDSHDGVGQLSFGKYGLLTASNEPQFSGIKKLLLVAHVGILICLTLSLIYLITTGDI